MMGRKPEIFEKWQTGGDADEADADANKVPQPFERMPEIFDPKNPLHNMVQGFEEGIWNACYGKPNGEHKDETEPPQSAFRNPITGVQALTMPRAHALSHHPHGIQEPTQQKKLD